VDLSKIDVIVNLLMPNKNWHCNIPCGKFAITSDLSKAMQ
jgi:hypothetical protein